ncbi:cache domain-containing protein [Sporomusa sp.]|uniref:cache domain-containing protein n=1 Tax=Sporomusa sp. TaxID=2078658 RepID=UPI002BEECD52|nr:cache domain-containing protein [Sporomusa sp.]HWR44097.1 cache domain-containing protein [Sporomusa sp.]
MQVGLKTKVTVWFLGMVLLICLAVGIMVIRDMKIQIDLAIAEKAKSDLATAVEIVDHMYPGHWQAKDGVLYKGTTIINDNTAMVDKIGNLTDDTVTIFLGNTRMATNVMRDGSRAVGTHAAPYVVDTVLTEGKIYLGEAEVVGIKYQTCYAPLKDASGQIIGMFYVGVSKKFADQLQQSFTAVAVLSARIALLFALATTCFIPVDTWSTSFTTKASSR